MGAKIHKINVKGDLTSVRFDSQLNKTFSDIRYGYGQITFKGTDEELDKLESYLVENEGKLNFKII